MISSFQKSRHHEDGLDAFALFRKRSPEAHLVLLGDGPLEPIIRVRALSLGLQNAVTFAGYQAGAAFVRWLQTLDEVWILGLGNDFSARAAAQARACGARVVAVDEGALGTYADALVSRDAAAIVDVAGKPDRRVVEIPSNQETAQRVVRLYEQVRT